MALHHMTHPAALNSSGSVARSSRAAPRLVLCRGLKENVAVLPNIEAITRITLQPLGHVIPNQEGKKASVAIYNHLAQKYDGQLSEAAAREGLQLYAEVVADAEARPGAHPNIDILFGVIKQQQQSQQQQPAITIVVERQ